MSDIVVSRAGSNSIFEFLHLRKPMLLIPLTRAQSRGDQILNAESFRKAGYSEVLLEEDLTADELISRINQLYDNRQVYIKRMEAGAPHSDALSNVTDLITQVAKQR